MLALCLDALVHLGLPALVRLRDSFRQSGRAFGFPLLALRFDTPARLLLPALSLFRKSFRQSARTFGFPALAFRFNALFCLRLPAAMLLCNLLFRPCCCLGNAAVLG